MALQGFDLTKDFGDADAEAKACRTAAALFDFSFIESIALAGERARDVVEVFTGRSLGSLAVGKIMYALRADAAGHLLADLTVWRTAERSFEVMSGRREDVADLLRRAGSGVEAIDLTPGRTILAVQGPRALDVLRRFGSVDAIARLPYFGFCDARLAGRVCRVGRLGYTGEAGFEIIVERAHAPLLWKSLAEVARPAGFTAADRLRIEAGFVLFTNEFRLPVSAREAGLGKFHGGADAREPEIRLAAFRAGADGLSWPWQPSAQIQRPLRETDVAITSACESPEAGGILCLGYVSARVTEKTTLGDPAGVFRDIRRVSLPFYDTAKSRPRAPWRAALGPSGSFEPVRFMS